MTASKYTPTITQKEFDANADDLRDALRQKYEAAKNDADRPPRNPATAGAFSGLPDLDSKTVARWSPVVKNFLGCNLDPSLIRKGGYKSFDDFWGEAKAKLRATCRRPPTKKPSEARTTT